MTRTRPWKHDYALHLQYRVQARHYQMEIPILPFATEQVWTNASGQIFMPASLQLLRKLKSGPASTCGLCCCDMLPALLLMLWAFLADRINASSRHTTAYVQAF